MNRRSLFKLLAGAVVASAMQCFGVKERIELMHPNSEGFLERLSLVTDRLMNKGAWSGLEFQPA